MPTIGLLTLLVRDYDEAIRYFVDRLGFCLQEDTPLEEGKRWVVVAPRAGDGSSLLLARAVTDSQRARIGDQAGGRVFLFLHTDDFAADYERLKSAGVKFLEAPRNDTYGTVAVFV